MRAASALLCALAGLSCVGALGPDDDPAGARPAPAPRGAQRSYLTNDSHVHLTNYVQKGPPMRDFVELMGNTVGRAAVFGIPLEQTWSYRIDGDRAPTYYLQSDAPLYYYSFVDATIATQYLGLPPRQRARLDPMICGFNPADMYAVDHIRRVLETYPGVFSGIGEFTIHKEFVSSKVAGVTPAIDDPALDRILDFAGEVGLVVLIHNDIDVPFPKQGAEPAYARRIRALFERHPRTTIIWAHLGVGRVIQPIENYGAHLERVLAEPRMRHVYFDISWMEAAKYIVRSEEITERAARLINKFPDRFLYGTDEVGPTDQRAYLGTYATYEPLWRRLTPDARQKVLKGNYERLFDAARRKVRAWERAHVAAR
jgi:hypothetical protein